MMDKGYALTGGLRRIFRQSLRYNTPKAVTVTVDGQLQTGITEFNASII